MKIEILYSQAESNPVSVVISDFFFIFSASLDLYESNLLRYVFFFIKNQMVWYFCDLRCQNKHPCQWFLPVPTTLLCHCLERQMVITPCCDAQTVIAPSARLFGIEM